MITLRRVLLRFFFYFVYLKASMDTFLVVKQDMEWSVNFIELFKVYF